MADQEKPQIYLVTPQQFELSTFIPRLSGVLDAAPIACLRLSMSTREEDNISLAADALRELAHARDIPLVISDHIALVEKLGLDGVHLSDGPRNVRNARNALGSEAIVGAFCGSSNHAGITAGEAGADYVSFGPVSKSNLGDGIVAERELFAWWSEMIELPVIAEGGIDPQAQESLRDVTDFLAFGEEIWATDDAAATVANRVAALG